MKKVQYFESYGPAREVKVRVIAAGLLCLRITFLIIFYSIAEHECTNNKTRPLIKTDYLLSSNNRRTKEALYVFVEFH